MTVPGAFTLPTICTIWVVGSPITQATNLGKLNKSTEAIWKLVNGNAKEVPVTEFAGFADVRDVGTAHLRAWENINAVTENFLVWNGS